MNAIHKKGNENEIKMNCVRSLNTNIGTIDTRHCLNVNQIPTTNLYFRYIMYAIGCISPIGVYLRFVSIFLRCKQISRWDGNIRNTDERIWYVEHSTLVHRTVRYTYILYDTSFILFRDNKFIKFSFCRLTVFFFTGSHSMRNHFHQTSNIRIPLLLFVLQHPIRSAHRFFFSSFWLAQFLFALSHRLVSASMDFYCLYALALFFFFF